MQRKYRLLNRFVGDVAVGVVDGGYVVAGALSCYAAQGVKDASHSVISIRCILAAEHLGQSGGIKVWQNVAAHVDVSFVGIAQIEDAHRVLGDVLFQRFLCSVEGIIAAALQRLPRPKIDAAFILLQSGT